MTLSSENQVDLIKDKIIAIIRHSTEDRVRLHTHNAEFTLSKPNRDYQLGQVLGNWMSMILVSGEFLRLTLKLHYSLSDVKEVAYRVYGKENPDALSDKQAMDFMKELCNLIAGQVVTIFEENHLPLGMSLPLCARGFYDIFSDYAPAIQPFVKCGDLWSVKCGDLYFMMTSVFEILDADALSGILKYEIPVDAAGDEDEEMDFL